LSRTVYLYIECSFDYLYRIEFAFHNCPCEAEVRELFAAYVFNGRTKEAKLKPSFSEFYHNVLAIQDSKHIYTL